MTTDAERERLARRWNEMSPEERDRIVRLLAARKPEAIIRAVRQQNGLDDVPLAEMARRIVDGADDKPVGMLATEQRALVQAAQRYLHQRKARDETRRRKKRARRARRR